MIIRTTENPNYLIVETGNGFTVYEKYGNSFVIASENSWKELSWAEAEVKSLSNVCKCGNKVYAYNLCIKCFSEVIARPLANFSNWYKSIFTVEKLK